MVVDLAALTVDQLRALYLEKGPGLRDSELRRTLVPLGSLTELPRIFQPRDEQEGLARITDHREGLARAIREGRGDFPPILVFACDECRIVLDGHSRLAAYREAGTQSGTRIPVKHLKLTGDRAADFAAAMFAPVRENSRDKLPLTTAEKTEAAWRLTGFNASDKDPAGRCRYSKKEISLETGVSESTIANMRRKIAAGVDYTALTWAEVLRGRRQDQDFSDEAREARISGLAREVRRRYGIKSDRSPELWAEVLERAMPRASAVLTEWGRAEEEEEREGLGMPLLDGAPSDF